MQVVYWLSRLFALTGFVSLALVLSCALRGSPNSDVPQPAETERPASGGVLHSSDAGLTWEASDLVGKWVTGIDMDANRSGRGFASVSTLDGIEVHETTDGGAKWSMIGRLPDAAGTHADEILAVHFDGDLKLIVGTHQGLWFSEDLGSTWGKMDELPEGAPRWLAAVEENGRTKVFVTINGPLESVPERGVYVSSDLATWTKLASGGFRLSGSFDRRSVLATDSLDMPNQGIVMSMSGQTSVTLPYRTYRAAGAFDGSAPMIADALLGMYVSDDAGLSWRLADNCHCSVGAAPHFPSSGVAVGGGFRNGVFRTIDGGLTWDLVLADPGIVVRGINEVGNVTFLSSTDVVAVNPAGRHWPEDAAITR